VAGGADEDLEGLGDLARPVRDGQVTVALARSGKRCWQDECLERLHRPATGEATAWSSFVQAISRYLLGAFGPGPTWIGSRPRT
jgi:hypothetical protein